MKDWRQTSRVSQTVKNGERYEEEVIPIVQWNSFMPKAEQRTSWSNFLGLMKTEVPLSVLAEGMRASDP